MTDRILTYGCKTRYLQKLLSMGPSLVCYNGSSIQILCWTTVANEIYHFFELKKPFQVCSKSKETIAYVLIQIPKVGKTVLEWF